MIRRQGFEVIAEFHDDPIVALCDYHGAIIVVTQKHVYELRDKTLRVLPERLQAFEECQKKS